MTEADLRASDHDRDTVLRLLGEQAALGRLTLAEHEQRIDAALAARTWGELHALTADLPVQANPQVDRAEFQGRPRRSWPPPHLACAVSIALIVLANVLGSVAPVAALAAVAVFAAVTVCVMAGPAKNGCGPVRWSR